MGFDVSLDLYKIFCVVVNKGNMSLAAKELFISQPAVSMAIKQLEEKMGKSLLVRSSKGIRTTTEGGVLYEYLVQAMSLIETAEKKYVEMANLEIGEIRIGASDTIISEYLMTYIEKFIELYPNINMNVTNRTTKETIKLLKTGQADIGFVNLPIDADSDLDVVQCLEVHDCLIGGDKFAYLAKEGIRLQELEQYPLLVLEGESSSRLYINDYAQNNGVILKPHIELGSSALLVKFAEINLGLATVIKEFTQNEIDHVHLFEIPITPPIPPRHIGLVKLKDVSLSYAAGKFAEIILSENRENQIIQN